MSKHDHPQTNEEQTSFLSKEFFTGLLIQLVVLGMGGIWAFSALSTDVQGHKGQEHVQPERVARIEENSKRIEQKVDQNTKQLDEIIKNQELIESLAMELVRESRRNN